MIRAGEGTSAPPGGCTGSGVIPAWRAGARRRGGGIWGGMGGEGWGRPSGAGSWLCAAAGSAMSNGAGPPGTSLVPRPVAVRLGRRPPLDRRLLLLLMAGALVFAGLVVAWLGQRATALALSRPGVVWKVSP